MAERFRPELMLSYEQLPVLHTPFERAGAHLLVRQRLQRFKTGVKPPLLAALGELTGQRLPDLPVLEADQIWLEQLDLIQDVVNNGVTVTTTEAQDVQYVEIVHFVLPDRAADRPVAVSLLGNGKVPCLIDKHVLATRGVCVPAQHLLREVRPVVWHRVLLIQGVPHPLQARRDQVVLDLQHHRRGVARWVDRRTSQASET